MIIREHINVLEMIIMFLVTPISYRRFFSFFSGGALTEDVEDIHAALALMYGYAARYAPSSVIEARIDALVV